MSDNLDTDDIAKALTPAVYAADNAAQAVVSIWQSMTSTKQDRWLEEAKSCWPRADIMLRTILPAAEKIIADERAQDS
jgi:hypothetical protein